MNPLPKLKISPPDAGIRENLAAWLKEWEIDRTLAAPSFPLTLFHPERTGEHLEPGQIRLMFPATPVTADCPFYLAVLRCGKEHCLMAPFGRFAHPAIPGEWLTGRTEPPIRVLCLWNQRRLREDRARQSWVTDRLTETQLSHALVVAKAWKTGKVPERVSPDRLGPPIVHPLDPRHEYIEEERLRMNRLVESDSIDAPAHLLAAESRPVYGVRDVELPALKLKLRVAESEESVLRINVLSMSGSPSHQLDGWQLTNDMQTFSAYMRDGQLEIPCSRLTQPIFLCSPDGARYSVDLSIP